MEDGILEYCRKRRGGTGKEERQGRRKGKKETGKKKIWKIVEGEKFRQEEKAEKGEACKIRGFSGRRERGEDMRRIRQGRRRRREGEKGK